MTKRPLGATILAVLAGVALLLAIVHLLQALGILPYFIGRSRSTTSACGTCSCGA